MLKQGWDWIIQDRPAALLLLAYLALLAIYTYTLVDRRDGTQPQSTQHESLLGRRQQVSTVIYLGLLLVYAVCQRAGCPELLSCAAAVYLDWEPLAAAGVLFAAAGAFLVKKNRMRFLYEGRQVTRVLVFLSVAATFCSPPTGLGRGLGIVLYVFLGILFVGLGLEYPQSAPAGKRKTGNAYQFHAVESFNELFEENQRQAKKLVEIIQESDDEPISICVSGAWGTGKTSIINGAVEKLKEPKENGRKYEFIYINALELDTLKSLFTYFFAQIKRCLKSRGVYVGFGSEYKRYIAAAAEAVTGVSLSTTLSRGLGVETEDYRDWKKQLSMLVSNALEPNGKIVVIVDDIERCNEEKAKSFIFFIKEVATMSNCAAVFLTDYEHLRRMYKADQIENNDEYLFYEKFFNYRIDLPKISYSEMMEHYEKNLCYLNYGKPSDALAWFDKQMELKIKEGKDGRPLSFVLGLKNGRSDQNGNTEKQAEKWLENLRNQPGQFHERLSNPRSLEKLYAVRERHCTTLSEGFKDIANAQQYFDKIQGGEILFLLSFIETCFPYEARKLSAQGRNYFEELSDIDPEDSGSDRQLIAHLGDNLLYSMKSGDRSYVQNDALRFVNVLVNASEKMPEIVNGYTKQEDEWLSNIKNGHLDTIIAQEWIQMVNMVLQLFFLKRAEDGEEYLKKLFIYAKKRLEAKTWKFEEILAIFSHDLHNETYMAGYLPVMELFWKELIRDGATPAMTPEENRGMIIFGRQYFVDRMNSFHRLLLFLVPPEVRQKNEDMQILDDAREKIMGADRDIEQGVADFLDRISDISCFKGRPLHSQLPFEKLSELNDRIEEWLKTKNLLTHPDINDVMQDARIAAKELEYYSKIRKAVQEAAGAVEWTDIDLSTTGQTDEAIQSLWKLVRSWNNQATDKIILLETNLSKLFLTIRDDPKSLLNEKQINDLHAMLDEIYDRMGPGAQKTLAYHKILLDYEETHKSA